MIKLEEGSKDNLPWIQVEIKPGRWWGTWWYEVSYWAGEYWFHDYENDGRGFGLWNTIKKGEKAMWDVWDELE
jgi:hypothetical protein